MPRKRNSSNKPRQAQTTPTQQTWTVFTYPAYDRFLKKNPRETTRSEEFLDLVAHAPYTRKSIKLKGYPDTRRIRSGDVRFFYNIEKPKRTVHATNAEYRKNKPIYKKRK